MRHFLLFSAALLVIASAAYAQTNSDIAHRIDRLERDIMMLQRQQARGGPVPAISGDDDGNGAPLAANMEVRLSNMEEQIRQLRGRIEEYQFQTRKLTDEMEKYKKDVDYQLHELAQQRTNQPAPPAPPSDSGKPAAGANGERIDTSSEAQIVDNGEDDGALKKDTTGGDGELEFPPKESTTPETPRDLYNHAFRLLNQTQYEKAAKEFEQFTDKYPKDPLIGNAYYWLGETYYIRRDYLKAADSFRQGFEVLPKGPKAPDNLLKLAISLHAMDQNKEACVVLSQIISKFKDSSKAVMSRAESERSRIGCN